MINIDLKEINDMLNAAKNIVYAGAIALGLVTISVSLTANAQTDTSDSFEFEKIEVGEDSNWSFSSENEETSVQDDLKDLKQYSISEPNDSGVRLVEEDRRWGNRGNAEDYLIKTDVYNY